jgi:hypothetical protein
MAREKLAALAMKAHMYRQGCYVLGITSIDPERNDANSRTCWARRWGAALPGAGDAESSFARVIATLSAVGTRGQSIEPEDHAAVGMPDSCSHSERSRIQSFLPNSPSTTCLAVSPMT